MLQKFRLAVATISFGVSVSKMTKILRALQIFDSSNKLSLTSIGVMVILTKIALAPTLDWATASTLLLALLSYNYKRHLNHKTEVVKAEADGKLETVVKQVQELNNAFNFKAMMK
jgi:uncharacterized membrane protein YidH (DUF202 family)